MRKKPNYITKFFAKNKSVASADHEAGLSDATSTEVLDEYTDEGSCSKA
jgi:hypothetical protein